MASLVPEGKDYFIESMSKYLLLISLIFFLIIYAIVAGGQDEYTPKNILITGGAGFM